MQSEINYTEYCQRMGIISSTELTDMRFERIDWLADGLLKPGLSILAGAPKIGKSWMVLQLCMAVAKGETFMGMPTKQSSVLYITLEDSATRIQERINRITEEGSDNLYVALHCSPLGEELSREIVNFCIRPSDARLVVIDTFQKIREQAAQMSYSGDYADISYLKQIADQLNITILLVHHTRKMADNDVINEISGTNGIAGSADTLMILKKKKRSDSSAILSCTGRDIEDRSLVVKLNKENCQWEVVSDDVRRENHEIPPLLLKLIVYAGKIGSYNGSNTEFCRAFCDYSKEEISPCRLKYLMNRYRHDLEDAGVFFISVRKKEGRVLAVYYHKREDGVSLPPDEAREEQAMWDELEHEAPTYADRHASYEPADDYEEIPLPGDDDAPPEREDDPWYYHA